MRGEYKKIKIPLILKKDIIFGDKVLEDTDTLKIFSKERKLKDIEFFDLFNFIEYLNKIDKCYWEKIIKSYLNKKSNSLIWL